MAVVALPEEVLPGSLSALHAVVVSTLDASALPGLFSLSLTAPDARVLTVSWEGPTRLSEVRAVLAAGPLDVSGVKLSRSLPLWRWASGFLSEVQLWDGSGPRCEWSAASRLGEASGEWVLSLPPALETAGHLLSYDLGLSPGDSLSQVWEVARVLSERRSRLRSPGEYLSAAEALCG